MPPALLHLVSEQTMQNLLPLLALRPHVVVQVRSTDPRFAKAPRHLQDAVAALCKTPAYHDLAPEFFDWPINASSPDADHTRRKVGEALSLWPGAVVNLTGGTKPMSIGAFLAAEYQDEPVLYCDTQQHQFVSLNPKKPLPELPPLDAVTATLNVEAILAAHGRPHGHWRAEPRTQELLRFGQRAAELREQADARQFERIIRDLRKHFCPVGKHLPRIEPLLADTPLKQAYFQAAAEAGLLQPSDTALADLEQALTGTSTAHPATFEPIQQSKRDNERLHKLLDGLWLELHILDLLRRNPRFADSQWSVSPAGDDGAFGETDIVCLSRDRAGLMVISCKSIAPSLEHFEALRRRVETFGGSHTQAVLAIFYAPVASSDADRCRRWADSLRLQLLLGADEIAAFFAGTTPAACKP